MARLWARVLELTIRDAWSSNGVAQDAREWLSDPAGAEAVLIGLGYTPQRARAAVQHALKYPPTPDTDPW